METKDKRTDIQLSEAELERVIEAVLERLSSGVDIVIRARDFVPTTDDGADE